MLKPAGPWELKGKNPPHSLSVLFWASPVPLTPHGSSSFPSQPSAQFSHGFATPNIVMLIKPLEQRCSTSNTWAKCSLQSHGIYPVELPTHREIVAGKWWQLKQSSAHTAKFRTPRPWTAGWSWAAPTVLCRTAYCPLPSPQLVVLEPSRAKPQPFPPPHKAKLRPHHTHPGHQIGTTRWIPPGSGPTPPYMSNLYAGLQPVGFPTDLWEIMWARWHGTGRPDVAHGAKVEHPWFTHTFFKISQVKRKKSVLFKLPKCWCDIDSNLAFTSVLINSIPESKNQANDLWLQEPCY